jgi:hypothetical protein
LFLFTVAHIVTEQAVSSVGPEALQPANHPTDEDLSVGTPGYSIFGIDVDRKHVLKWLFSKEIATLHALQKVYAYSENALGGQRYKFVGAPDEKCGQRALI